MNSVVLGFWRLPQCEFRDAECKDWAAQKPTFLKLDLGQAWWPSLLAESPDASLSGGAVGISVGSGTQSLTLKCRSKQTAGEELGKLVLAPDGVVFFLLKTPVLPLLVSHSPNLLFYLLGGPIEEIFMSALGRPENWSQERRFWSSRIVFLSPLQQRVIILWVTLCTQP